MVQLDSQDPRGQRDHQVQWDYLECVVFRVQSVNQEELENLDQMAILVHMER